MGNKKVACILVTFNRIELLKRSLNSIYSQTYKDFDIIVVDNGSTDGTAEWLDAQNGIVTIHQENTGSAGGFYTGMKYAFDNGYEWMWLMDDDGVTDSMQLERLMAGANRLDAYFVNALVCDIDCPDNLSFGLPLDGRIINKKIETLGLNEIPDYINPWNGTLINREVAAKIGFPKKEMFIWGEETEYMLRAKSQGFQLYTITNAIHLHPLGRMPMENLIPFCSKKKVIVPSKNREKIFFRNSGYISRYQSRDDVKKGFIVMLIYYTTHLNLFGLFRFCKYYKMGVDNNFKD